MFLNCGAQEDSRVPWTVRRSHQSILKEINPEYSLEGCCWSANTLATWCKEPTRWKRPCWWERSKAKGEEGGRGWDGWRASLTQWTWVWANSGRLWRAGKPVVLQSMGCQRVGHDRATEQQQENRTKLLSESGAAGIGRAWLSPTLGASRQKSKSSSTAY